MSSCFVHRGKSWARGIWALGPWPETGEAESGEVGCGGRQHDAAWGGAALWLDVAGTVKPFSGGGGTSVAGTKICSRPPRCRARVSSVVPTTVRFYASSCFLAHLLTSGSALPPSLRPACAAHVWTWLCVVVAVGEALGQSVPSGQLFSPRRRGQPGAGRNSGRASWRAMLWGLG